MRKILSIVLMNLLKSYYWVLARANSSVATLNLVAFWFVDKSSQLGLIHARKCCAEKEFKQIKSKILLKIVCMNSSKSHNCTG